MSELIADYIILESGKNFAFKVPLPEYLDNEESPEDIRKLFNELKILRFNKSSEVILFRTKNGKLGVIGEEFTGWYSSKPPILGIKLRNTLAVDSINLLNMKPAKGPGFGTISLYPMPKELIFFNLTGNERNWDHNFKKTEKLMVILTGYLGCSDVNTIEKYNA